MEHHQKGMSRKWQRHYPETRTTIGAACILLGICICIPLVILYPQKFAADIFNSRLAYHLTMDIEDLLTCDKDYTNFIIDEPTVEDSIYSYYIFNITNAADVLNRGYKPKVRETGPYAYTRKIYKYDVSFNNQSTAVSYKEYYMLRPVTDPLICPKIFFQLDNAFGALSDPCVDGACVCKSHEDTVTIVNPLFLKLLYQYTTSEILGKFSSEIFTNIYNYLQGPFVEATKATLVNKAMEQIFKFRTMMKCQEIIETAIATVLVNTTYTDLILMSTDPIYAATVPTSCGIKEYLFNTCPVSAYFFYNKWLNEAKTKEAFVSNGVTITDYPSLSFLFNSSSECSLLHPTGLARWTGLTWSRGFMLFDDQTSGFITLDDDDQAELYTNMAMAIASSTFPNPSANNLLVASVLVDAIAEYVAINWLIPGTGSRILWSLAFTEYATTHEPLVCNPLLDTCVYQWNYMNAFAGSDVILNSDATQALVSPEKKLNTNPINLFYFTNGKQFYNTQLYCQNVLYPQTSDATLACQDYSNTFDDGQFIQPAFLWAAFNAIDMVNATKVKTDYSKLSDDAKLNYLYFSCNVSSLLYDVYRSQTDFHDKFVVKYLNKFKDPTFTHKFTVGNWDELGYAQFAGGFVTDALLSVRSTYQLMRDGMWKIMPLDYYSNLIEFSTWCTKTGFPSAYIYSVADAATLLSALRDTSDDGIKFRSDIVYAATTLYGDDRIHLADMFYVGEKTFVVESNYADFSCSTASSGMFTQACNILTKGFNSSSETCDIIDASYLKCATKVKEGNFYVVNCGRFQTSRTSASEGIQCDDTSVYGKDHPYYKSRGNVLFQMLQGLTIELRLKTGLWCSNPNKCKFNYGGLFVQTQVKRVLFEGFTDPSVVYFLNLDINRYGMNIKCRENAYDACGDSIYKCNNNGLLLTLADNSSYVMSYDVTPYDEYYVPYYEVVRDTSEMIWRFSMNATKVIHALYVIASGADIVKIYNPYWTAFPALDTNNTEFIKFYQCQQRLLHGDPLKFGVDCLHTIDTGRESVQRALNMISYYQNTSIYTEYNVAPLPVYGTPYNQFNAQLWDGFDEYPYGYKGNTAGSQRSSLTNPTVFDTIYGFQFTLSQSLFVFSFERDIPIAVPIVDRYQGSTEGKSKTLLTRRFTETKDTWAPFQEAIKPLDSYGMPYKLPVDSNSIEKIVGFPAYISTPHMYGNQGWLGSEWSHVSGYRDYLLNFRQLWTYLDHDPVTGKSIRSALRGQVNIRVERNPLFINVFSSQNRCIPPTKQFSERSGYGCFAYIPLYWHQEARLINVEKFYRLYDHFYSRPIRAHLIMNIGIALTAVFILIGACILIFEDYHRKRFKKRVYVD